MSTIDYTPHNSGGRLQEAGRKDLPPEHAQRLGLWAMERLQKSSLENTANQKLAGPVGVLERLAQEGHELGSTVLDPLKQYLQDKNRSLLVRTQFGEAVELIMTWFQEGEARRIWKTHSGWIHPAKGLARHPNLSSATLFELVAAYDPRVGKILVNRDDLLQHPRCVAQLITQGGLVVRQKVLLDLQPPHQLALVEWLSHQFPQQALQMVRKAITAGAPSRLARPLLQAHKPKVRRQAMRLVGQ